MSHVKTGQVSHRAAEVYEQFFVPALFGQWPPYMLEAVGVRRGQRVLDVACGTGVLARHLAQRVEADVTGLDPNPGMLAVARRQAPAIDWRQGVAEEMPFEDAGFDGVVSQFGLMFFQDRNRAIEEMVRVLRPGHCLAVAVWDSLERTPGYGAAVDLLQRLFGEEVADALRAPFVLGEPEKLTGLFRHKGLTDIRVTTYPGTARFPSLRDWIATDVKGWTLADLLGDEQYERLQREAHKVLGRFQTDDGTVAFAAPAHIVTATRC